MTLHLNKLESHSPINVKYENIFSLFCDYLPLEKGVVLLFTLQLKSSSPKDALYKVSLKLVQWFWRGWRKCGKCMTTTETDKLWSEKLTWAPQLRWAKQEAHGPQHSPAKPVKINELWLHINISWNWFHSSGEDFQISWMYFCYIVMISLCKKAWPFNMNKLKSTSPKDVFFTKVWLKFAQWF